MRYLLRAAGALALVAAAYLAILALPPPFFAHHVLIGRWEVWSDRPLDANLGAVLGDAERRLRTSSLYGPRSRFRVFFCNSDWRMGLFSQRFTSRIGGAADTWLTRNIYIRAADIPRNRLVPPGAGPLLDESHRPLSYFIAHEATHILESRAFGRAMFLTHPQWLVEGYADYVGKGGDFDYRENQRLLTAGDPLLDYAHSGLYRRFHLEVAYLLERQGWTIQQVFARPPRENLLLAHLYTWVSDFRVEIKTDGRRRPA